MILDKLQLKNELIKDHNIPYLVHNYIRNIINFNYNINSQELKAFLINNFSALEVNYENIPNDTIIKYKIIYKKNNKCARNSRYIYKNCNKY